MGGSGVGWCGGGACMGVWVVGGGLSKSQLYLIPHLFLTDTSFPFILGV